MRVGSCRGPADIRRCNMEVGSFDVSTSLMPLAHKNLGAEESMRGIRGWLRRAHYAGEYILMHRGATMTWIYEDREEKRGSEKRPNVGRRKRGS